TGIASLLLANSAAAPVRGSSSRKHEPLDFVPQGDQAPQQFRQEADGRLGVLFGDIVPPAAHAKEVLVTRSNNHYLAFGIWNRYRVDHLYITSGVIHAHL